MTNGHKVPLKLSQIDLFTGPFNLILSPRRPSPSTCPVSPSPRSTWRAPKSWPPRMRTRPRGPRSSPLTPRTWWPSPSLGARPLTSSGWRPSSPTSWTTNNNRWQHSLYLSSSLGWSNSVVTSTHPLIKVLPSHFHIIQPINIYPFDINLKEWKAI